MAQSFDVEQFDPAPSPELICAICQNVLYNPVECLCHHVFCELCLTTWLSRVKTCPTCRSSVNDTEVHKVMPLLQNLLKGLKLRCGNHSAGCEVLVTMERYELHMKDCPYQKEPCIHCAQDLPRKFLDEHQQNCMYKLVKCEKWCGQSVPLILSQVHDCRTYVLDRLKSMEKKHEELAKVTENLRKEKAELERELADVKRALEVQTSHHSDSDGEVEEGEILLLDVVNAIDEGPSPTEDDEFNVSDESSDSEDGRHSRLSYCPSLSEEESSTEFNDQESSPSSWPHSDSSNTEQGQTSNDDPVGSDEVEESEESGSVEDTLDSSVENSGSSDGSDSHHSCHQEFHSYRDQNDSSNSESSDSERNDCHSQGSRRRSRRPTPDSDGSVEASTSAWRSPRSRRHLRRSPRQRPKRPHIVDSDDSEEEDSVPRKRPCCHSNNSPHQPCREQPQGLQPASSSDFSSDSNWQPGSRWYPESHTSDVEESQEESSRESSDYNVYVPKTAAQLLQEYQSCDSDDSWHE